MRFDIIKNFSFLQKKIMPELFIEPLTDRQTCFKCQKTVTGKKKLSKCAGCHAITYCGVECQREDWPRHNWNCVPVMVTEIPGKGRGFVAARDIKMGELIFKDKPVITLPQNIFRIDRLEYLKNFKTQVGKLPTEAKAQFYKLMPLDMDPDWNMFISILADTNDRDAKAIKLFLSNARTNRKGDYASLYLNLSLVNHSCAPNAEAGELRPETETGDHVHHYELRAIKKISRGDEINICYIINIKRFGYDAQKRKAGIMQNLFFDCACSVCKGQVADQEEIMKRSVELQLQLNPLFPDVNKLIGFKKGEVRVQDKIVDLTMQLYVGNIDDKRRALDVLVRIAHLARDQNLVKKAMDTWKQLAVDTNLAEVGRTCQIMENSLSQWSKEFKSRKAPKKREIDFIYYISFYD